MKRGVLILIVAVTMGIAGFVITRQQCCCSTSSATTHDSGTLLPELEWLHHELKLTDEQFAKVTELHVSYRPTCEALCMKIAAAHRKVQALAEANPIRVPELEGALVEQSAVHLECQKALLKHLLQTADVMSPEQAKLYLEAMLPQVTGGDAGQGIDTH